MYLTDMPCIRYLPAPKATSLWQKIKNFFSSTQPFELSEDFFYRFRGITVKVPKGFRSDGASVPRALWALENPTGPLLIPGLLHDFAYRHGYLIDKDGKHCFENSMTREFADSIFKKIAREVNDYYVTSTFASDIMHAFSENAWESNAVYRLVGEVTPFTLRGPFRD